jgi:hypothetical protein
VALALLLAALALSLSALAATERGKRLTGIDGAAALMLRMSLVAIASLVFV